VEQEQHQVLMRLQLAELVVEEVVEVVLMIQLQEHQVVDLLVMVEELVEVLLQMVQMELQILAVAVVVVLLLMVLLVDQVVAES
jgi:hypothetical protein